MTSKRFLSAAWFPPRHLVLLTAWLLAAPSAIAQDDDDGYGVPPSEDALVDAESEGDVAEDPSPGLEAAEDEAPAEVESISEQAQVTLGEPDVESVAPAPEGFGPRATCARTASDAAADSVVRVRTGGNWGAGFVYGTPRRVVTAWSLMTLGRPVTVVARDGTALAAQLLTHDAETDIAVLELTEDVPGATPLSPAPETSAEIGRSVIAIGHPFANQNQVMGRRTDGLLRWSTSTGTIGTVNPAAIQADVALAVGHAGAPLLDCEGRVLGVIAGTGLVSQDIGLAARISQVDDLLETAGSPGDFLGDLQLKLGIGVGLLIDEEGRTAAGFDITLGGVLFDRLSWLTRVGFYGGGIDGPSATELSVSRNLLRIESLIGYRIFLDVGGLVTAYIVPAIGATISFETVDRATASVVPAPAPCTPSETESCVVPSVTRTTTQNWLVRPAIGFTIILGSNFEIGYTLALGLDTAEEQASAAARGITRDEVETIHNVRLGLLF